MTAITANLIPAIEVENGAHPTHAILWMHGLGADGSDFVPFVDELALPPTIHVRFLFPHAPMRPVSINRGMVMRAWYDFDMADSGTGLHENMASLHDSQRAIEALVAREKQRGIKPENMILAGFSQGGAMALHTGLRYPEKLAGIVALSTYLPVPRSVTAEAHPANFSTPVFMAHGETDHIIPMMFAAASRQQLLTAGYTVDWHEYPMAHGVCKEEIADIGVWLQRMLV